MFPRKAEQKRLARRSIVCRSQRSSAGAAPQRAVLAAKARGVRPAFAPRRLPKRGREQPSSIPTTARPPAPSKFSRLREVTVRSNHRVCHTRHLDQVCRERAKRRQKRNVAGGVGQSHSPIESQSHLGGGACASVRRSTARR